MRGSKGRKGPNRHAMRPKKSLGQNFLQDPNIARKIIDSMDVYPEDRVLEIGPGTGVLTERLVGKVRELIAVEIDGRAVEYLKRRFHPGEIRLLHQDVLDLDLHRVAGECLPGEALRIVGNIPYNITSPILFRLLEAREAFQDATLMMQREVARRLVARPGTREYGILAVLCGLQADVRLLFDVSPNAFFPKPQVMSTMVRLTPLSALRCQVDNFEFFRAMVRFVFGQRRKTLRNSLRAFMGDVAWTPPDDLDLRNRPEALDLATLARLANHCVRFTDSR